MSDVEAGLIDQLLQASSKPGPNDWATFQHLQLLVAKIQALQTDRAAAPRLAASSDVASFTAWAAAQGITASKVVVKDFGIEGKGLSATQAIAEGESLLSVPLQAVLTTKTALDSPFGAWAKTDPMLRIMPNVLLALYLVTQLRDDSRWLPYIKMLPRSFGTPLYWAMSDVALLKGTSAYEASLGQFRNIARQYAYLHKELAKPDVAEKAGITPAQFTFEDYRWAVSVVMTRQNQVVVGVASDGQPQLALGLVPFWDLMNHDNGKVTTFCNVQTNCVDYSAMKPFAKDEQVTMYYGDRSNSELVVHSGFFFEKHPSDFLELPFALKQDDPLVTLKTTLLNNVGIAVANHFVISSAGPDAQLVAHARVCAMTEGELNEHLAHPEMCASLGTLEKPVSAINEKRAVLSLLVRCKQRLAELSSPTEEEDRAALQQESASYAARCARLLRQAERAILSDATKMLDSKFAQLK